MAMVAVLLICSTAAAAVLHGAFDGLARGRAQGVADLVALASVHDRDAARRVAQRNGASIESIEWSSGRSTVIVRVGERRAVASARLEPVR